MRRTATSSVIAALILGIGAVPALADVSHDSGTIEIPPFEPSIQETVEVVPLTTVATEHVTLSYRMEVQHMGSTEDRMSTLVLYHAHEVTAGDGPSMRIDLAFFDGDGHLLGTWEYSEGSAQSFDRGDPGAYPTSNVMEAATMWELPPEVFDAVSAYQLVLITR